MKAKKEIILFTNYFSLERFDETAKFLKDEHGYHHSDEKVFEEMSFIEAIEWEDFRNNFSSFINKNDRWIIQGNIGRWNGNFRGGFIFSTYEELTRVWRDCDYVKFSDIEGHLFVQCSHHDGSNLYEIKRLTNKGLNFAFNNDDCEEIHNSIFDNNFFSGLPYFARDIYGLEKKKSA